MIVNFFILLLCIYFVYSKKNFLFNKNNDFKSLKYLYNPKTENQQKYFDLLNQDNEYILTVYGPPGTGKTLLACVNAIQKLKESKIDKIIITRPVIAVEDENIGFLPGNIDKKMDPWTRPIYDVFLDFYSKAEIKNLIISNKIEISPLGFMRGRTFKNCFILADEMQNSTPNQMLMLLTRLGHNSKIVITGDLEQSDILNKNGLQDLVIKLNESENNSNYFHLIKMIDDDIQRCDIVKEILKLYKKTNEKDISIVKEISIIKESNKTNEKNITIVNEMKINYNNNNDAALIPINHILKNYK